MNSQRIADIVAKHGLEKFRAKQISDAFFKKHVFNTNPRTFSTLHSTSSWLEVRRMFFATVPRFSVLQRPSTL